MAADPPICAECQHVHADLGNGDNWMCIRPIRDVVTGEMRPLGIPCREERRWVNLAAPDACGRQGKHFQAAGR